MADWQAVGRQRYVVTDDTIAWHAQGDVTALEITQIFSQGILVQAQYGYALFFIAIVGPWSFPAEARRALAEFHRQHKAVGVTAVVGASQSMRLFIDLVLRAVAHFSGQRPATRFFRTPVEAQRWLDEQRTLGQKGLLGTT